MWTVAHLCIPPARAASFAFFQTLNSGEGKVPLQFARPKSKSLHAVPSCTSTDKGHGVCLPAASICSWTGTLPEKQLLGCELWVTQQAGPWEQTLGYSPFLH